MGLREWVVILTTLKFAAMPSLLPLEINDEYLTIEMVMFNLIVDIHCSRG